MISKIRQALKFPQEVEFTHWSVLWLNRRSILLGTLCLVAVDAIVFVLPYLIKLAVDVLQGRSLPQWIPKYWSQLPALYFLLVLCATYLACSALIAYGRHWWRVHLIWSTFRWFHQMRDKFFKHAQGLHREFFKGTKVGDLISALTTDTENMRMMVAIGGLMAIDACINFIFFPILLWSLNPSLTLIVVPPLIGISILAVTLSGRLEDGFRKIQDLTAELSARAFELCSGIRVIKAFRRENEVHDEYVSRSRELRDISIRVSKIQSLFLPGLDFSLGLALCFVLVFGGLKVISGQMPLSNLVAFQLYLAHMDWPMMCIGWFIQMYRQSQASQRRVQAIGDTVNPLSHGPHPQKEGDQLFEVDNIVLTYPNRRTVLFENLSIQIPKSKWIGLTGPVGCGKSSLLELLSRQRDPDSGDIYFLGQNLKSISYSKVPEQILYVPQEAYMFSKSIRRNLLLGGSREEDEALWSLLNHLRFDQTLLKERGGLDARLGERGTNLSGGQKQRLSLGRSLLKNRQILLLDDLFSHVDAETESKLIRFLHDSLGATTSVMMVSQRIETLAQCDFLIVLNEGSVECSGPSSEVLEKSLFMKRLKELQDFERQLSESARAS